MAVAEVAIVSEKAPPESDESSTDSGEESDTASVRTTGTTTRSVISQADRRPPSPYEGFQNRLETSAIAEGDLSLLKTTLTLQKIGTIRTILDNIIVVESTPGTPPLDLQSVLFLNDKTPLGRRGKSVDQSRNMLEKKVKHNVNSCFRLRLIDWFDWMEKPWVIYRASFSNKSSGLFNSSRFLAFFHYRLIIVFFWLTLSFWEHSFQSYIFIHRTILWSIDWLTGLMFHWLIDWLIRLFGLNFSLDFSGRIFDVFGPVIRPLYSLRFESEEDFDKITGLTVGADVSVAPSDPRLTSYVFLKDLLKLKGTDASWEDDGEAPEEMAEFSDDETERQAKQQKQRVKRPLQNNSERGRGHQPTRPATVRPGVAGMSGSQPRAQWRPETPRNAMQPPGMPFGVFGHGMAVRHHQPTPAPPAHFAPHPPLPFFGMT